VLDGRHARRRSFGRSAKPWEQPDCDGCMHAMLLQGLDYTLLMPEDIVMLKLSSLGPRKQGSGAPAAKDADFEDRFPCINILMTATVDDAGKPRQPCTLNLVCETGLFKGGLRDKDSNSSLWRSAPTFSGLLEALEKALETGEADWRETHTPRK